MAANIWDWSTTAASNASADSGINWAENQAPSSVNNSARAMMGRVAEFLSDIGCKTTSGGSATAMTLTTTSAFGTLANGLVVGFKAGTTNTSGAVTLAVNSLTAKPVKVVRYSTGEQDPSVGAIMTAGSYLCRYDTAANSGSGAWILLNPSSGDVVGQVVTVNDSDFTIRDNSDNTKLAKFEASGITTGTTRTYTLPDASGTLALSSGGALTTLDTLFTLQDDGDATKQLQFQLSGITTGTMRTLTVPDASTTLVGTDTTQTLTSKTLTSPTITGATITTPTITVVDGNLSITGSSDATKIAKFESDSITTGTTRTLTFPDLTGTIALTSGSQTFSSKTLDNTNTVTLKDTLFTLQDDGDTTKQVKFNLSGITTGTTRTYTLPDASGELVDTDSAQSLFNKTYDSLVVANVLSITGTAAITGGDARITLTKNNDSSASFGRNNSDGTILEWKQDDILEGAVSVSGTTITYGSFSGSHWSQLADNSTPCILPGTIMETIDEMCEWPGEANEQLAKCKVSDTPASTSVYGVFMAYAPNDRPHDLPEGEPFDPNPTGDFWVTGLGAFKVRIRAGETVHRGDFIESAGDGTGRVQADTVLRASTVAKVASAQVIDTYQDGSFTVPATIHCS